jgi:sialate O-acetylesterase
MVLQRAPQRAIVWGFSDPGIVTTLTMNDKIYTTISRSEPVNEQGESIWSVTLDPVKDEGPFDIHVSQPLSNGTLVTITLHDVLFGDVWICSGQSNMQFTVSMIYNATEEIANASNYPKIRVFTAVPMPSASPVEELLGILLNWSIASSKSVGGPPWQYMSAVCWLYGRMIHQALGDRPIGLIATSYGGTAIEVWMPPKALQDCNTTTYVLDIILFFLSVFYRKGNVTIQPYDEFSAPPPVNHSSLFNSMIYPFTRTVIYGVIWYQGEKHDFDR